MVGRLHGDAAVRVAKLTIAATFLLIFGSACAPTVKSASSSATRGAVPAAADASLSLLEDPATRQRVAAALGTPEMQLALRELSSGLSQGVVKGLASDEMNAHTQKLVGSFLHTFMVQLGREMNVAIDSAFATALSPRHRQQLEQFTAGIVAAVMKGAAQEMRGSFGPALRQTMTEDVGPALAAMMRDDLAPEMARMIKSPEFKSALSETTREVSRQAVLGSNDALAELKEKRREHGGGIPLSFVGALFEGRTWLLGALVVGVVLAIPLAWLLRERRQARQFREEAERRTARTAALLGAMESAPEGAWSSHVLQLLRNELLDDATKAPGKNGKERDAAPHSDPRPRHA